jgi:hypothetical protein
MCEHGAAEQTSGTLFRPIAPATCGARIAILSREGRMANMKTGLGICGLIVLTVLPVDGEGPLRVAVTPIHSFAPATVTIRARIEPSAENRMLAIVADGDDFYRSSEIQLDGVHAPKIVELRFSNLPGGVYQISAVLADGAGRQRAIVRQSVNVIAMAGSH